MEQVWKEKREKGTFYCRTSFAFDDAPLDNLQILHTLGS